MALPVKKERHLHETDVLEVIPPSPELSRIHREWELEPGRMTNQREPAMEHVSIAVQKLGILCGKTAGRVELIFHELDNRARSFSREMRRSAGRLKNENPLQALAIIAAATFVAGMMLRIWRSQKNG
jgi:hypothetical protein